MSTATSRDRPRLAESIASYDRQPDEYAARFAGLDTSEYIEWLAAEMPSGGRRVLDLGCGTGRDTQLLRAQGFCTLGLDLSRSLVRLAQLDVPDRVFVVGDARALPIRSGSLDGVWAMASLVHLDTAQTVRALEEAFRVLRDDGAIFVSVPWGSKAEWRPDSGGGRRWFRYFRSSDEVEGILRDAGFTVRRIENREGIVAGRWISAVAVKSARSVDES